MRDSLVPIVEDHQQMKADIAHLLKEVPEQAQNVSVALSRIAKLNKTTGEKDDKIGSLNKLVTNLFTEVTNLLGQDSTQEERFNELKQSVDSNTNKLE